MYFKTHFPKTILTRIRYFQLKLNNRQPFLLSRNRYSDQNHNKFDNNIIAQDLSNSLHKYYSIKSSEKSQVNCSKEYYYLFTTNA